FRCLHCPYGASSKQTMVEHIYHHTDIVPYFCGLCGAIFGTKGGVKVHARREHKCKYCTFLTNYYPVIIQHGSTKHSKYRELLCTYCKYKLVDNAHIKFHYNTQHPGI
ncbi:hypothetical protein CAPTEDRAFT_28044, partial [Capitella teleta]